MRSPDEARACKAIWLFSEKYGEKDFSCIEEAQELVDKFDDRIIVKKVETKSSARHDRTPPEIWLSTWRFCPAVLMHELAHLGLGSGYGHGVLFLAMYKCIIERVYGHGAAILFDTCLEECGYQGHVAKDVCPPPMAVLMASDPPNAMIKPTGASYFIEETHEPTERPLCSLDGCSAGCVVKSKRHAVAWADRRTPKSTVLATIVADFRGLVYLHGLRADLATVEEVICELKDILGSHINAKPKEISDVRP